jgi:hypothetical protein
MVARCVFFTQNKTTRFEVESQSRVLYLYNTFLKIQRNTAVPPQKASEVYSFFRNHPKAMQALVKMR